MITDRETGAAAAYLHAAHRNAAAVMVLAADAEGSVLSVSPAMSQLLLSNEHALRRCGFLDLVGAEELHKAHRYLERIGQTDAPHRAHVRLIRTDGKPIAACLTGRRILDPVSGAWTEIVLAVRPTFDACAC